MKSVLLFLGLFIFINLISAQSAGVSPTKIELNLIDLKQKCEIVWIDLPGQVNVEIFWSDRFSENPLDYNLRSDQIGVLFTYKEVNLGEYNFCFQGTNKGRYYGVTQITSQKSLIALGNFVSLNVIGGSKIELFTGKAIQEIKENNLDLWFIFLSLTIILFSLVVNIIKRH